MAPRAVAGIVSYNTTLDAPGHHGERTRMSAYLLAVLLACGEDAPKAKWHTDLGAAAKLAKEQKRPLFVVFRCDH